MESINIDQLAAKITQAVQEYTEDVSAAIEKEIDQTAAKVLKDVKELAPKDTGAYAKGFRSTKQTDQGYKQRIVWNKAFPTRVHLLEFGHAKVGGGRVEGKPHLGPAYDKAAGDLTERIKQIIKNGG